MRENAARGIPYFARAAESLNGPELSGYIEAVRGDRLRVTYTGSATKGYAGWVYASVPNANGRGGQSPMLWIRRFG